MKYDEEEKSILDAYKKGKLTLSAPSMKEIEAIKATARKTMVKDKRITIRLYEHDYQGIQKKGHGNGYSLSDTHFRHNSPVYRRGLNFKDGITV
jgi:predicted DNA binding CopG/RHH family protein